MSIAGLCGPSWGPDDPDADNEPVIQPRWPPPARWPRQNPLTLAASQAIMGPCRVGLLKAHLQLGGSEFMLRKGVAITALLGGAGLAAPIGLRTMASAPQIRPGTKSLAD